LGRQTCLLMGHPTVDWLLAVSHPAPARPHRSTCAAPAFLPHQFLFDSELLMTSPTPKAPPLGRTLISVFLLALAAMAAVVLVLSQGRTRALPAAPAPAATAVGDSAGNSVDQVGGALFPCVSYAPFRRPGDTPLDPDLHIAPDIIEADLRQLATTTGCVRTYGLDHGLDAVPTLARKLGLQVVLGVWISGNAEVNQQQLRLGLSIAQRYPDVVKLLMVGNEVLLRRELPPSALAELLAQAKAESTVPVSYADVWEFWLRHAAVLLPHVQQVSVHILPYWEDDPVGIDSAAGHVHAIASKLQQRFGTTPVWVAETGWPAIGRQRGPALPGRWQQAQFVREMLQRQASSPLDFNLIEGFDQPWKRALEGAMGGGWGLFDAEGELRVPLQGDLPPATHWQQPLWALAGGALLGVLMSAAVLMLRRRSGPPTRSLSRRLTLATGLCSGTALVAWAAWLQFQALVIWSRDAFEWFTGGSVMLLSSIGALALLWRWALLVGQGHPTPLQRAGIAQWWLATRAGPLVGQHTRASLQEDPITAETAALTVPSTLLLAPLLFAAAAQALALVFDARYRPLPVESWCVPALLLLALLILGDRQARAAREERLLAGLAGVGALLVVALEGLANTQALMWAAALLVIAAATLWRAHRQAPAALLPELAGSSAAASSSKEPSPPASPSARSPAVPAARHAGSNASAASKAAGAA